MKASREAILVALFEKLKGARFAKPVMGQSTFVTTSRRLKLWSDVPSTQKPALYLTDHDESPIYQSENLPQKNTFGVQVWVYFDVPLNSDETPSTAMNLILDAIDAALGPDHPTNRLTLGGLVSHCRIEGSIMKDPGDIDGEGLILIPLRILAT